MKRPAFQFYPGDWLRDTALRSCSVGAQGLWINMICLMHEGTPYGFLKVNHNVILAPNLSRMIGATLSEVEGWLDELRGAGVFSENEHGIFSRRMIRDEEIRASRAAGGIKGGNPDLMKKNLEVNLQNNLPPTPASASASAPSVNTPIVPKHPKRTLEGFDQFWSKYPKKKSKGAAERAWQNLNGTSLEVILQAVQDQIPELLREGGRYCPYPATWLNQKKWEDELTIFQNRSRSAI